MVLDLAGFAGNHCPVNRPLPRDLLTNPCTSLHDNYLGPRTGCELYYTERGG